MAGEQVLVCPGCQTRGGTDGLDLCASCGSTVLVKRLGEVVCRACGHVGPSVAAAGPAGVRDAAPREALAADVAAALDRVLRGGPST